jgi:PTS system cellobiose-specific IIA component
MDQSEMEQILFNLILHAGEARTKAKEAAEYAKERDWESAQTLMDEANEEQLKAHEVSAQLIKQEAKGEKVDFSILLAHALDLLILAWSEIDYTDQFIETSKRLTALEDEVAQWKSQKSLS